ncbi:MAG: hypothetical protein ACTSVE_14435 [Candidatus Helarchaeota archaeon]
MVVIFNLPINDYFAFILFVLVVIVLAVVTIKGEDFLINIVLVLVYDVLDLVLAYFFVVYFAPTVAGIAIFTLVFALIGIGIQTAWGLKVIIMDGVKGGWRRLRSDTFQDK